MYVYARFCWLVRFILGMGTLYVSLYNLVCSCCIPVVSPLNSMCVCVCVYIYIYIFLMHIQNKKKKILTWLMSWYNKMVYSDCNIAMWFASWSMFNGESTLPCFLTIYSSYFILVNGIAEEFFKFFEIIQIVNWDIFFLDQKSNRSFILIKKIKKDQTSFHSYKLRSRQGTLPGAILYSWTIEESYIKWSKLKQTLSRFKEAHNLQQKIPTALLLF